MKAQISCDDCGTTEATNALDAIRAIFNPCGCGCKQTVSAVGAPSKGNK